MSLNIQSKLVTSCVDIIMPVLLFPVTKCREIAVGGGWG